MITSKEICDKWDIKPSDNGLLFAEESDYDRLLRNTPFKSTGDDLFDKKALIHWWMQSYVPDGYGADKTLYEIYSTYSNANYKYLKYIYISGYNPHTNQSAFKTCLNKNSNIDKAVEELNLILPYVKPYEFEDYYGKYMGVFESTLSEHGVYNVLCEEKTGDYILGITRYGSYQDIKRFTELKKLLDYIRQRHYYKKNSKEY